MKIKFLFISILTVLLLFTLTGCSNQAVSENLKELAKVEVKEYEGKDLSSIVDFRENSIAGPQNVDITKYKLKIDGLVNNPGDFTYDEILANKNYTKLVKLNCVEGWSVDILWEGVLLKDIFDKVQVKEEANTVIFYAVDGYSSSLPLSTIQSKNMLMAFKMNGVVLPPERGYPFQLVAEDKLGYKWVKWINHIELSKDKNYQGYWEKRGYDNEASIKN